MIVANLKEADGMPIWHALPITTQDAQILYLNHNTFGRGKPV